MRNVLSEECRSLVRSLYAWEFQEAQRVFAAGLNYEAVRIHECASWPNTIHRIGLRLRRLPYDNLPNAITLGNHCYFPLQLLETLVPPHDRAFYKLPWLIHELTHVWQYQHWGWRYLALALQTQLREGANAYDFGGEGGLREKYALGWEFKDFNLEQQGDIARSYYERIVRGLAVEAWQPFIAELQGA